MVCCTNNTCELEAELYGFSGPSQGSKAQKGRLISGDVISPVTSSSSSLTEHSSQSYVAISLATTTTHPCTCTATLLSTCLTTNVSSVSRL